MLLETRRERECEGYIRLVFHTLDLFSFHLEALGDMLVNQSRVKGNENVSNVLPRYWRYCNYILIQFYVDCCFWFEVEKCGQRKLRSNFWSFIKRSQSCGTQSKWATRISKQCMMLEIISASPWQFPLRQKKGLTDDDISGI